VVRAGHGPSARSSLTKQLTNVTRAVTRIDASEEVANWFGFDEVVTLGGGGSGGCGW